MERKEVAEKIKNLIGQTAITFEYYCKDCGYLIYRTINSDELSKDDHEIKGMLSIPCFQCEESEMEVVNVYTYEEWIKENPHFSQGG